MDVPSTTISIVRELRSGNETIQIKVPFSTDVVALLCQLRELRDQLGDYAIKGSSNIRELWVTGIPWGYVLLKPNDTIEQLLSAKRYCDLIIEQARFFPEREMGIVRRMKSLLVEVLGYLDGR